MNLFSKLGGNIIAERIKTEAGKLIDEKVTSAAINSLFPSPEAACASPFRVHVSGSIEISIERAEVGYIQHTGKDEERTTLLEPKTKSIKIDSFIPLKRAIRTDAEFNIEAHNIDLVLSSKATGIAYKQLFMGMGATIDSIDFKVAVTGYITAKQVK